MVYFGNDWNAENRTSSHHIAIRLAQRMPVLYVDSPGMRAPTTSGRDLKRAWRKLTAALRPPVQVRDGLWHCTVPQLPFRRIPGVDAFNRVFSRWAVRRAIRARPVSPATCRGSWYRTRDSSPTAWARISACTTASTTTPPIPAWTPN